MKHPLASRALLALALAAAGALAIAAAAPPYNLDRAIEAQNQLVAVRPDDAAVWNDLGNLLTLKPDYEKAEACYRRAIELDPEPASPHFNLGLLLERRGEHRAALKELRRVVDKEPGHAWAHYQIGVIYHRWRLDSFATRSYARAFKLDPSLADARINPHVLDNELAARALMRAHDKASDSLLPPRTYEEPARIAALMIEVPKPANEPEGAVAADASGFARPAGATTGPRRFAAQEDEEAETGQEPPKRLTTSDLEPGSEVNQIANPGAVGVAGVRGGTPRGTQADAARPRGFAGRVRPAPAQTEPPSSPPAGGTVGTPGFTPAPDSTGRLELRLLQPASAEAG